MSSASSITVKTITETFNEVAYKRACADLDVSPPPIKFRSCFDPTLLGVYRHSSRSVEIYPLTHNDLVTLTQTVLHELRHAHQHQKWPRWFFNVLSNRASRFSRVGNYSRYERVLTERDARKWAEENARRYPDMFMAKSDVSTEN